MNVSLLYPLVSTLVNHFSINLRLRRVLRDFVLGVFVSRSCLLDDVAHALTPLGQKDSQYRRLQRFLANKHLNIAQLQTEWAHCVIKHLKPTKLTLLVDETALSDHLKVMVLGVWTLGGCVPIAWWCYHSKQYPTIGQVGVIATLLDRVRSAFPFPMSITLLADQGIGTSPHLIDAVENRGIQVLFRVQGTTRFRHPSGQDIPLANFSIPNKMWQSAGDVFKKSGWRRLYATVAHDERYDNPWCLVSSDPIDPHDYANRFDQEVSFRDLKSDGFQWHRSHVWKPDHADRLLLVLAMTYWLIMAVAQRLPDVSSGRQTRLSSFRRALDMCIAPFRPTIAPILYSSPPPIPPPRISCVVQ